MSGKLIIKIKKDGTIEAETTGIKGKKCEDYVKVIEELTQSKVIRKEYTREYYEEEQTDMTHEKERTINY